MDNAPACAAPRYKKTPYPPAKNLSEETQKLVACGHIWSNREHLILQVIWLLTFETSVGLPAVRDRSYVFDY